ncbi:glutathione S-transferase [Rhizoclosmatium globosum]|uniref:Glutathione S-transferase n=1 Tax=Rhizoclosmatium globosum TaxID=329046 RepID=A0A1Y2C2Y5_9FUNG|nr:hypothetical protein HDU99_006738 [Rhizoclosmatium hyalinum]KAJ3296121.1 hypothetical protein HDU79_007547 [Rhizoclosmatium sp. JEL0117]ORY41306.1 glutathione S-transferase [Rhizoclosmatium globosum]|eukprot:ORY41306.1 glutathione S-transferase [Rhizoclosmatium globosum]
MASVTLYTTGTFNGLKAVYALNELKAHYGFEFAIKNVDIFSKKEQQEEWFQKINPNGKIPALVDHKHGDFAIFESAAILLWLAEHYDPENILFPSAAESKERSEVTQWLFWQMSGLGPIQGQANLFINFAPEKIPFAINRYTDEVLRLYGVLEKHLSDGRQFVAAGRYTIADLNLFGHIGAHNLQVGITLEKFPLVDAWLHRIAQKQAVLDAFEQFGNKLIQNDFRKPAPVPAPSA